MTNTQWLAELAAKYAVMPPENQGMEGRLLAEITRLQFTLNLYREFYHYMVSCDYQNDLLDIFKDDMSTSDSAEPITAWADYDALLNALKECESELNRVAALNDEKDKEEIT